MDTEKLVSEIGWEAMRVPVRKDDVRFSGLEILGRGKLQIGKFCTAV